MAKRLILFAKFFVASFGVLNFRFPLTYYFENVPSVSRAHIISSFLLLALTSTLLAAVAFPLLRGKTTLLVRVARTAVLYFVLISMFAIACSGLGFGLSLGDLPFFGRFGFFFAEWEWTRFIFESALPLTALAAGLYFVASRPVSKRNSIAQ